MSELSALLSSTSPALLVARLGEFSGLSVYPRSIAAAHGALFFLGQRGTEKRLGILYAAPPPMLDAFTGLEQQGAWQGQTLHLRLCTPCYANAAALHRALPYTRPRTLGLHTSAGCGDRLGLATPGHVRAVRNTVRADTSEATVAPILAQQSIREMERSGRTPEDVINDATWGVFQEGWRGGYGADADHLKTRADVDVCVAAGFTFYTFDPREHVDNDAHSEPLSVLKAKAAALPWDRLNDSEAELRARYLKTFSIEGDFTLTFDEKTLLRAAAKYGKAIAHVAEMYRYLAQVMNDRPFEVEVSVDETDTTTSPEEHFFIAGELRRLDVEWVSLAPRYVGRFEKGVDYIGDLDTFEAHLIQHAAIARRCGPYKLSIHSGSDKFSIYPLMAKHTRGLVHLKTAGTSYLEALRAIARVDPPLFREILDFSFQRYAEDKATYHVSADPAKALANASLSDDQLLSTLDNFHNRQMLHVTYGSVLSTRDQAGTYQFKDRLLDTLRAHEETYYQILEAHFDRHVQPFNNR